MSAQDKAKKSLGQHWLNDQAALDHICGIAQVHEHDSVLEIGPGKGTLTRELLNRGAHVAAVEIDTNLYKELVENMPSPHLTLVNQDIMEFDLALLPPDYKVVANIPYYLTSHLIRVLSESSNLPKSITLLVQKEVAERICSKPGGMSILSVSAQFYFDVELGDVVPKELFSPAPKVDSQVVHMLKKQSNNQPDIDTKAFFRVVKAGFAGRRKTLLNSLSAGLHLDKTSTKSLLKKIDISPSARPQELSVEEWAKLARDYMMNS